MEAAWITNEYSDMLVHKWRSEEDAIMVGTNTALNDNPQLNVRHYQGTDPIRIVIDRNLGFLIICICLMKLSLHLCLQGLGLGLRLRLKLVIVLILILILNQ